MIFKKRLKLFLSISLSLFIMSFDNIAQANNLINSISDTVDIDSHGFLYKDGVKIFPIGVYVTEVNAKDLARIKDAGFNTILSYSLRSIDDSVDFLNLAGKYNLNVIYSLKDYYEGLKWSPKNVDLLYQVTLYVNRLKSHKSLLAWYVNDELPLRKLPAIKRLVDKVSALDKKHPVLQVLYDLNTVRMYVGTSDIIALDAYPVGEKDNLLLSTLAAEKVVSIASEKKSPWLVPQMMDWGNYKKNMAHHPPTQLEMQNQVYQGLIAGVKGIIFYSYYDLFYDSYPRKNKNLQYFDSRWGEVVSMMKNVSSVIPIVLHGHEIYKGRFKVDDNVKYKFYKYNGSKYLLVANPNYKKSMIEFKGIGSDFAFNSIHNDVEIIKKADSVSLLLPPLFSGEFID